MGGQGATPADAEAPEDGEVGSEALKGWRIAHINDREVLPHCKGPRVLAKQRLGCRQGGGSGLEGQVLCPEGRESTSMRSCSRPLGHHELAVPIGTRGLGYWNRSAWGNRGPRGLGPCAGTCCGPA